MAPLCVKTRRPSARPRLLPGEPFQRGPIAHGPTMTKWIGKASLTMRSPRRIVPDCGGSDESLVVLETGHLHHRRPAVREQLCFNHPKCGKCMNHEMMPMQVGIVEDPRGYARKVRVDSPRDQRGILRIRNGVERVDRRDCHTLEHFVVVTVDLVM